MARFLVTRMDENTERLSFLKISGTFWNFLRLY